MRGAVEPSTRFVDNLVNFRRFKNTRPAHAKMAAVVTNVLAKLRDRKLEEEKKKEALQKGRKRKPKLPGAGKGKPKKSLDDDEEEVSSIDLNHYHCADRSNCLLGMQTKWRSGKDTRCHECKKEMHIDCGVAHIPTTKQGRPVKKPPPKCRLCYYCSNDEAVSDDESIDYPSPSGAGVVTNDIAKQRREVLAGKKGMERMMEARAIAQCEPMILDDHAMDRQKVFIDVTFRHWG